MFEEAELQHTDDVLDLSQVQSEWLEYLLKEFEKKKEIVVVEEIKADASPHIYDVIPSI
jgi:hypothetical protein